MAVFVMLVLRRLMHLRRQSSMRNEFCCDTLNALRAFLSCLLAGMLVASKLIALAFRFVLKGLVLRALWCLSMRMTSIALVGISGNGVIACPCSSSLVATDFAQSRYSHHVCGYVFTTYLLDN
jgi:hypothetical protein